MLRVEFTPDTLSDHHLPRKEPVMTYWYLATPYSKWEAGLQDAFEQASKQAAVLVRAGIPVFCPISMTHPIAIHGGIDPYDYEVWIPADKALMDSAGGLIICQMEGWDDSKGIQIEIEVFQKAGKPIVYMKPDQVPVLP